MIMSVPKIFLKPGKEQSLRRYHPWVFSGAILKVDGQAHNGDIVEVVDSNGKYLATGHCSEGSIAVRIFSFNGYDDPAKFWKQKINDAYQLRRQLGFTDNPETNIYRLVHAEGDGMPGMIIDIYGTTAVMQSHSVGMHEQRQIISEALREVYGDKLTAIFDRGAEKVSGKTEESQGGSYLFGSKANEICFEYGSRFKVDWETGQKTGYFIDQRENRKLLGEYSKGKKVLNTFCYTGGFSVHALQSGASLVHSLDSSQKALELATENVALNGFEGASHDVIKADAVEYMKNLKEDYDIIVLDPPAFAKHLSARHKAVQGYIRINEAAIRQIKPGGIIFTFSCSQVIDKKLFHDSVMAAGINARRQMRILHQLHQPADHPISIFHPEGEYLKGLVVQVM